MGVVYRAHDEVLHRDVAVKVLPAAARTDPDRLRRFEQEARAAGALNHPNILAIYDFGEHEGAPYVASELLEGRTLQERMGGHALPVRKAVEYGIQIARGLSAAHEKGIVHRDLKPENLFVTNDGRVKILDFGIVKLMRPEAGKEGKAEPAAPTQTEAGVVLGTTGYMSPEQVRGETVDHRSDLFALGAVLYEMLSGRRAFSGGTPVDTMSAILSHDPPSLSTLREDMPADLDRTIRRCLEKSPRERFQTAWDLASDLERLAEVRSGAARVRPRRWLVPAVVGPGVIALAALAALTNVGGWRSRILAHGHANLIRSIAVLPLENFSRDPEQEYFVDGMTEELTTTLAQVGVLKVISRTSSMQYKGTKKTVPEIGRELGVDAVIEGSVMRAGDRVRVTAQLIRASTDEHLWAQSYERDLKNVLTLQSDVARAIAGEIGARLRPEAAAHLAATRLVVPAAYEAYLRGRHYLRSDDEASARKAIAQFEEAIRIDSTYAPAWAGLADGWYWLSDAYVLPREAMPKVRTAAIHALDLDPGLAEAHAALGAVQSFFDWEWGDGERSLRRAIELNPNSPTAHRYLSYLLECTGRADEAVAEARSGAALEPLSNMWAIWVTVAQYYAKRYGEAIAGTQRLIEKEPTNPVFHGHLGLCYMRLGRFPDAVAEIREAARLPGAPAWTSAYLCYAYAAWGKTAEARRALKELVRRSRGSAPSAMQLAMAYVGVGERDRAFEWLDIAFEERAEGLAYLNIEPGWNPLRSDPRFQELLRRMRLAK